MALSPESGNPFSRDARNPFSLGQEAGGRSVDYQETIEYVLAAAGIEDPLFITAEMQYMPGLVVAWEADGVNGFVLSAEGSVSSMDTDMVDLVGSLGEDCAGHYASAAKPAEVIGTYAIKDGFGTCATGERRQISYVTGIFDEANALYFIQYSEDEGSVIAEEHHTRLRDALKLITEDLMNARH